MFSIIFESLKSKSTKMLRPQTGNSRVSFNDTLLNFGLRGDIQKPFQGARHPLGPETPLEILDFIIQRGC